MFGSYFDIREPGHGNRASCEEVTELHKVTFVLLLRAAQSNSGLVPSGQRVQMFSSFLEQKKHPKFFRFSECDRSGTAACSSSRLDGEGVMEAGLWGGDGVTLHSPCTECLTVFPW